MAETDTTDIPTERLERFGEVQRQHGERLARIEGLTEQMDRRLSNIEQQQRQLVASMEEGFRQVGEEFRQVNEGFRQVYAGMERNQRWLVGLVLGAWVSLVVVMVSILLKM